MDKQNFSTASSTRMTLVPIDFINRRLTVADVVILLCSGPALERIKVADRQADNMLLEDQTYCAGNLPESKEGPDVPTRSSLAVDHAVAEALAHIRSTLEPIDMTAERSRLREVHMKGTRNELVESGDPGVGKSVVASLVADALQGEWHLGAAFFCKHDDSKKRDAKVNASDSVTKMFGRKDPYPSLLHTLAYGLATWNHDLALALTKVLDDMPDIKDRPIREQFKHLVQEPLNGVTHPNTTVVFVVDALDECGMINQRQEILNVLSSECPKLPSFVKLFITSRKERDIEDASKNLEPWTELEVEAEDNQRDAALYVSSLLAPWDTYPDIDILRETLISKSKGLFIWLSIAAESLKGVKLVEDLRIAIRQLPDNMDVIYERTMHRAYQHHENLPRIMEFIIVSIAPLSVNDLAALLDLPELDVQRAVQMLSHVLHLGEKITVKHKTVFDYLTDPKRCTDRKMLVRLEDADERIALACLRAMKQKLRSNMCNVRPNQWNSDIDDLQRRIEDNIPFHLNYAATWFIQHIINATTSEIILPHVTNFLREQLLNWFEIISVLGLVYWVGSQLALLKHWLEDHSADEKTLDLLNDARRFLLEFHVPISKSAAHVRHSAFPFCPTNSELYRQYQQADGAQHPYVLNVDSSWGEEILTIDTGNVDAVDRSYYGVYLTIHSFPKIHVYQVTVDDDLAESTCCFAIDIRGIDNAIGRNMEGADDLVGPKEGIRPNRKIGHTERCLGKFDGSGANARNCVCFLTRTVDAWDLAGLPNHNQQHASLKAPCDGHRDWVEALDLMGKTSKGPHESVNMECVAVSIAGVGMRMAVGFNMWICNSKGEGTAKGLVQVWDVKLGAVIWEREVRVRDYLSDIINMELSEDGACLVLDPNEGSIEVWHLENESEPSHHTLENAIPPMSLNRDGKSLITSSDDDGIKIWDPATGRLKKTIYAQKESSVNIVSAVDDESFVTFSSFDLTIKVWRPSSLPTPAGNAAEKWSVETVYGLGHTGYVMTKSFERFRIWDVSKGAILRTFLDMQRSAISKRFPDCSGGAREGIDQCHTMERPYGHGGKNISTPTYLERHAQVVDSMGRRD
ncbi:hypothetical protein HDV00_007763 [Rhizophlyctis rosea]|nr:hypothetical protein HDV00_007763 [Rhizophlyctis rosea]